MTPQEKADELIRKFYIFGINNTPAPSFSWYECKKCALIAVDEIISAIGFSVNDEYWLEVKQEIEKL